MRRRPARTTPIRRAKPTKPTDATASRPRRSGGRPSRQAAEQLRGRIIAAATELFLAQGYGATSIEAVARRAGISKRTFYHRFPDKAALFGAVIRGVVERLRPNDDASLFVGGDIGDVLFRVAQAILKAALTAEGLALYRIIVAEAGRFPELAATVAGQGASQEGVTRIAALLRHMLAHKETPADGYRFAATQFLFMVLAVPQRRAIGLGSPMTEAESDQWARDTVRLFLDGAVKFR